MKTERLALAAVVLIAAEAALCLASWVASALWPELGVRSVFSGEGARWLLGHHAEALAAEPLTWILEWSATWGLVRGSGLAAQLRRSHRAWRERVAMRTAAATGGLFAAAIVALAIAPGHVMLSVSGDLWPSPLTAAAVPLACLGVSLCSLAFGIVAGRFASAADACKSLLLGIRHGAPLLLLWMLLAQLHYTVCFILPQNHNYWVLPT